jgi:hypothetical protein
VVWGQPGQIVHKTLSWKYPTQKRAGGMTQVVERLPRKCEALSLNHRTAKKKNKKTILLVKIYICNIQLLTMDSMLYSSSLGLTHFIQETLYLLKIYLILPPLHPGNHHSAVYFCECGYFRVFLLVISHSNCLSLAYFT